MRIVEDTRNKPGKHDHKRLWFEEHGIEVVRHKLDFGDYALDVASPKVSIDTKRNVAEVANNVHGRREHERIKREFARAAEAGCALVMLVENIHGYGRTEDVAAWENDICRTCWRRRGLCDPHAKGACTVRKGARKPVQGAQLSKAMLTMAGRYNVIWDFCAPADAAARIAETIGRWEDVRLGDA